MIEQKLYNLILIDNEVISLNENGFYNKLILPSEAKKLANYLNTYASLYNDGEIKEYNLNSYNNFLNDINSFSSNKPDKIKRYVYLFKSETNKYKIGISNNPLIRIKAFNNPSNNVKLVCMSNAVYSAYKHEQSLHEKYSTYSIGNEWFDFKDDEAVINNVKQDILNLI